MAYINKLGSEFQLFCTQTSGVSSISLLGSCREWIEAQGTLLTISIGGSPIFSVTDAAISSGSIGLYSWGNAGSFFDDVVAGQTHLNPASALWA